MEAFQHYAKYYDLLYSDKDYEAEVDFVEEVFRRFSYTKPQLVLDAGCGTGGHAIPLAKRGYHVVGVDASPAMLELAYSKIKNQDLTLELRQGDIRRVDLEMECDACICMFAVLSYQTKNQDLQAALSNIRRHLNVGALFVADFWYGPAVLTIRPTERMKIIQNGDRRIIRCASPKLDTLLHLNETHYRLFAIDGNRIEEEVEEKHTVRFFFPQEIRHYLEGTGYELVAFSPFPRLDGEVTEQDWNVAIVARAV